MLTIAYFITPHGFGHAARACAVMNAIAERNPEIRFAIYTLVPRWVFEESLRAPFDYRPLLTDVGVVQRNALEEDLVATLEQLDQLYPLDAGLVRQVTVQLRADGASAVICDIAPLGIAAARELELPSFLIENFTWDWIYAGYLSREPRLNRHIQYLEELFQQARYHIQTPPVCSPAPVDLVSGVVSRKPRLAAREARAALGVEDGTSLILITMGGIPERYPFVNELKKFPQARFVIPAASREHIRDGNLVLLPHRTPVYHPDIAHASDAVVGKLGYSTLAEAYHSGVPYAYIPRPGFRETVPLADFVTREMDGLEIAAQEFPAGGWVEAVLELASKPRRARDDPDGADTIADFVLARL